MKTLKVKLLVGRSGADVSHTPGDKVDLPVKEAISLVNAGSAVPVEKKVFNEAVNKLKAEEEKRQKIEEQNRIRLEREAYELELLALYGQVVDLEAALAGVVLSDEQKKQLVEELKNREARIGDNTDKQTSNT